MSLLFALSFWRFVSHDIWHPVTNGSGPGYLFWSGIASFLSILGLLFTYYRKHNCHAKWCLRLGRHPAAGGTYVVCHKHHLDVPDKHASAEHIHAAHHEWKKAAGLSPRGKT